MAGIYLVAPRTTSAFSVKQWGLDTVALLEKVERPDLDICFKLAFSKARERTPQNRSDFEPAVIALSNDRWEFERGDIGGIGKRPAKDRALTVLVDQIARHGQLPPANEYIPLNTLCVPEDLWTKACESGCISAGDPDSTARATRRAKKALVDRGVVGKWKPWVWVVR